MTAIIGAVVGIVFTLWFFVWLWWRPKRPRGRSQTCAACRHDLLAHQMNIGSTRCQCCLYHRGLAQKNR